MVTTEVLKIFSVIMDLRAKNISVRLNDGREFRLGIWGWRVEPNGCILFGRRARKRDPHLPLRIRPDQMQVIQAEAHNTLLDISPAESGDKKVPPK